MIRTRKVVALLCLVTAGPLHAQRSAAGWIARADTVMGIPKAHGNILAYQSVEGVEQNYQSDRTYPPFFSAFAARETWLDPATGVERSITNTTYPGFKFAAPATLTTEAATFILRDTVLQPTPTGQLNTMQLRPLDPWAMVLDWSRDSSLKLEGHRKARDYDRVVLLRTGRFGPERLLLDPKTGFPVTLERVEPHYLWGQVAVEYVYSNWALSDGVFFPGSCFRRVDGATEITRTVSSHHLVSSPTSANPSPPKPVNAMDKSVDSTAVPSLRMPDSPAMTITVPGFLQPTNPDTIRISDNAFLLTNRGYTEAAVLARDTVFVLDATQGDERARQDSVWIGKLFAGKHPIAVVVTDLAWPHVAGVRFWVASGATIISHEISKPFLEQVVSRRWTRTPDRLERTPGRPALRLRTVRDSLRLAGGAISLYPIDGITSEGALIGFLKGERFLWGSDYVQTVSAPNEYALEVYRAVRRTGVSPTRLAAEHLPMTSWDTVTTLVGGMDGTHH